MLKTSARDFLDKECPKALVREMMEDQKGYSPELWKKMAELGWLGLVFPEEYDGTGSTFLDLAVLVEEMGRALLPGPFIPTVVMAGRAIEAAGTKEQKQQFLSKIANGELTMTLAFLEPGDSLEASGITLEATPNEEDYVIEGKKLFVPFAHVADYILCVARTRHSSDPEDGITLFLVDAKTSGIHTEVLKTMTGEKLCEVVFRNVIVPASNILGELNKGWPVMKRILDEAAIAQCAWMSGGARWVLETTAEYTKTRVQFDHPIGSFQAIQHKCANMAMEVEGSTPITYYAAWVVAQNSPEISLFASIAKSYCSDIYEHVAAEGIQIHGGIGFTWDHDMHLYFKQAKATKVAFGDGDYHREKVAQLLNL